MRLTPETIAERLAPWWAGDPLAGLPLNATTRALCAEGMRCLLDPAVLRAKMRRELPHAWRPLGRVLVVVAEGDVLGTVFALIAGALTGNAMRVKARTTRAIAEEVAAALKLPDVEIADWTSDGQDDAAVLANVDGVLLAGSEAAVRHYRALAPSTVRLVEFGPKRSLIAVGVGLSEHEIPALADAIWAAVRAFDFGVCSAPQRVYVDPAAPHEALWRALLDRLPEQPTRPDRLAARVDFETLRHTVEGRHHLGPNGWCVSTAPEAPAGVRFCVQPIGAALGAERARWGRRLQTVGVHGVSVEHIDDCAEAFSRICRVDAMHRRSPLAPHDGQFELSGLVDFVQNELRVQPGPDRVFLTGATGFIGQHLARALRDWGNVVTALARPGSLGRVPMGCRVVRGDVTRPEDWAEYLRDQDCVVHLAARYVLGPIDPERTIQVNVEGTRGVLDAAISARVPRIVHVSSSAAYGAGDGDETGHHDGRFRSVYEASKHLAHGLARRRMALGAPVIIAAPGGVFGPGDRSDLARVLEAAAAGRLPVILDGRSRFTLCHVSRIVDGLLRVIDHSPTGEEWLLTGTPTTMPDLVAQIARIAGHPPPRTLPTHWLTQVARVLDLVARRLRHQSPISAEALAVLSGPDCLHRSDKARRRLAWHPGDLETDLRAWLTEPWTELPCVAC
jgi:dihydroflavonol-4-reductase